jgi:hypothetical protein
MASALNHLVSFYFFEQLRVKISPTKKKVWKTKKKEKKKNEIKTRSLTTSLE